MRSRQFNKSGNKKQNLSVQRHDRFCKYKIHTYYSAADLVSSGLGGRGNKALRDSFNLPCLSTSKSFTLTISPTFNTPSIDS